MTDGEKQGYAEAIRVAWGKKRGAVVLMFSPIDYVLIRRCLEEDVPLRVTLRGIAECAGRIGPMTPFVYAEHSVRTSVRNWLNGMNA